MKSARYGLSRQLQAFFETELCGLFKFDAATILPPEPAPRPEGWSHLRRPPFGKFRELISVQFAQYNMEIASPNEKPPLGEISIFHHDGQESGPLDQTTWERIGAFVRKREGQYVNV